MSENDQIFKKTSKQKNQILQTQKRQPNQPNNNADMDQVMQSKLEDYQRISAM